MADLAARRRLMILLALSRVAANLYMLEEVDLIAELEKGGYAVDPDTLRADLKHLRNHDCVVVDTATGVWIATLTRSGQATAKGVRPVEGVAVPPPGL